MARVVFNNKLLHRKTWSTECSAWKRKEKQRWH